MICYCCFFRVKTGTRAPVQRRFFVFDWSKTVENMLSCQLMSAWHSLVVIHIQLSNTQSIHNRSKHNYENEKKSESEKGFLIFALILEKIGYHYQMVTIQILWLENLRLRAQECGKTNKKWGKMKKSILISTF